MFVDFEFIPTVNQTPHETTRTVDPGILYRLNHGFTTPPFSNACSPQSRSEARPRVAKQSLHTTVGLRCLGFQGGAVDSERASVVLAA
jgi:hypothetical protein